MVYKPEENTCYYALKEDKRLLKDGEEQKLVAIKPSEAQKYNNLGFSIFFTVQKSPFGKRKLEDITELRAYAVDLDNGTKEELLGLINRSPATPSLIIETKNGFHIYFVLAEPIKITDDNRKTVLKDFNIMMENRLVPYFQLRTDAGELVYRENYKGKERVVGADINAKDLARILRVPNFKHIKDKDNPYNIKLIVDNEYKYKEDELRRSFPYKKTENQKLKEQAKSDTAVIDNYSIFWEAFSNYDCRQGLEILSGQDCVNKDVYTFRKNADGTEQIYVNDESTACWVDSNNQIGSHDRGGPTMIQWLRWYKHDYSIIAKIGKDYFGLDSIKPTNYRMALMLGKNKELIYSNTDFYYYDEDKHVWVIWEVSEVRKLIHKIMLDNGQDPLTNKINDIFSLAKDHFHKGDILNSKRHILTFNNTVLNTMTLELLPFSPTYYSTILIKYDYDSTAKCEKWLSFIDDILLDEDLQKCIQEMMGYCLTTDTQYHVAFFLDGAGRNGKSTFMEILKNLVGQENVSNTSFHTLSSRFGLQNMENKLLNYDAEISADNLPNTNMFKAIVGGDSVEVERKFRDSYTTRFFCKLVYAANELPSIRDRSKGFFSRLIIIPFLNEFTKEKGNLDRKIIAKLSKELPGILNWAIEGLKRVREQDGFTVANKSIRRLDEYMKENSSLLQFIDEECIVVKDAKTSSREFFIRYTEFCRESGLKPFSKKKAGMEVAKLPQIELKYCNNSRTYINIKLREEEF